MRIAELILLALGLSMDAFAVAVCKGLAMKTVSPRAVFTVGGWFGAFQGLMPLIGYLLGSAFRQYIESFDHWVAFTLLTLIGGNMIHEAKSAQTDTTGGSLAWRVMLTMAIATSVDALAAGIPFAFFITDTPTLLLAVLTIGALTFVLCGVGVKIGNLFGARCRTGATAAGGCILILLGCKILLQHLGYF